MCVLMFVRACVRVHVRACVCVCVHVRKRVRVHYVEFAWVRMPAVLALFLYALQICGSFGRRVFLVVPE